MGGKKTNRREHAGGVPKVNRSNDQWVSSCDFLYQVVDGFSAQPEPTYHLDQFSDALKQISLWMLNDGKFQERGLTDRAFVFAWMVSPEATGCETQAEVAAKMNLSRSQVNSYVKEFTNHFNFVSGSTYSARQSESRQR